MNPTRLALASTVAAAFSVSPFASAEPTTFDFKDPKGVNGVTFILDSELEPFVGIGGGMEGVVSYDPEQPESFSGEISIAVDSLQLVNGRMTDVMLGGDWLDVAENTRITVTFNEVLGVESAGAHDHDHADGEEHDHAHGGEGKMLQVAGTLSFAGIELEKEFNIHATHIADGGTERGGGEGDLLVLRSMFEVSRYDLGIQPDTGPEKVAEAIRVIVPVAGYSQ